MVGQSGVAHASCAGTLTWESHAPSDTVRSSSSSSSAPSERRHRIEALQFFAWLMPACCSQREGRQSACACCWSLGRSPPAAAGVSPWLRGAACNLSQSAHSQRMSTSETCTRPGGSSRKTDEEGYWGNSSTRSAQANISRQFPSTVRQFCAPAGGP